MTQTGSVSICQFEPTVGAVPANLDRIFDLASEAEGDVLVFPELCLSGYDVSVVSEVACSIPCAHTDRLTTIADQTDTTLVVGLPEATDGTLYNSAVVVTADGVQSTYRKQYLTGGEAEVFTPGDEPAIVETPAGKLGLLICYDMSFPEAMIPYGDAECDFVAVPSAWRHGWHDDWRLLAQARALENTCYVAAVNQRGSHNGRFNEGESLIASPYGRILLNLRQEAYTGTESIDERVLHSARESNPVVSDRANLADDQ